MSVTYGVTEDPVAVGFDIIPKLPFDIALCRGYPNMHAVVETYGGSGYRGLCGWIQLVTAKYYDTLDQGAVAAETSTTMDKVPSMADADMPFAAFGYVPALFDAPCRNLNGYRSVRWMADSFLTTVPMRSRDEDIRRLAGYRWGYIEYNASVHRPVSPLPLTVTAAAAWNDLLPFLRKTFTRWRFAADT